MTDSADDCPFCDIVKAYPHPYRHAPPTPEADTDELAHIVFSTPYVIAFLDRLPLTKCHTLLIPRQHHELISSTPTDIAAELGKALPLVCRAAVEVSDADAFNVIQNNGNEIPFPHSTAITPIDARGTFVLEPNFRTGLTFRNKCWTGGTACAFSYRAPVQGV